MAFFHLVLGALFVIGGLGAAPARRWTSSPRFFLLAGATFTLAGVGGLMPGLWKLPFLLAALGFMTTSAVIDERQKRRSVIRDS